MFVVFLDSQKVNSPIGVHEFERKEGVVLLVSARVTLGKNPDSDHINQTLDYTQLLDIVNKQASKERQLLETLASDIYEEILKIALNPIENIHIRIEKPHIPHTGYAAKACGIEFYQNNQ
jgi:dihydroneopterin aldolase